MSMPPPPEYGAQQPGYAAPRKGYAPNGQEYAVWPMRVVAYLIDYVIPVLIMIPGIALGINWSSAAGEPNGGLGVIYWFFWLIAMVFVLWNVGYRQSKTGKSIGKSVMKLTTVDAQTGQYKGFWWLLLRQFLLGIDFAICYIGVLWPLWDDNRQCLVSDKATSTVVLKDN